MQLRFEKRVFVETGAGFFVNKLRIQILMRILYDSKPFTFLNIVIKIPLRILPLVISFISISIVAFLTLVIESRIFISTSFSGVAVNALPVNMLWSAVTVWPVFYWLAVWPVIIVCFIIVVSHVIVSRLHVVVSWHGFFKHKQYLLISFHLILYHLVHGLYPWVVFYLSPKVLFYPQIFLKVRFGLVSLLRLSARWLLNPLLRVQIISQFLFFCSHVPYHQPSPES